MISHGSHQMTRWQRDRRAFIEHRIYWHGSIVNGGAKTRHVAAQYQASGWALRAMARALTR